MYLNMWYVCVLVSLCQAHAYYLIICNWFSRVRYLALVNVGKPLVFFGNTDVIYRVSVLASDLNFVDTSEVTNPGLKLLMLPWLSWLQVDVSQTHIPIQLGQLPYYTLCYFLKSLLISSFSLHSGNNFLKPGILHPWSS